MPLQILAKKKRKKLTNASRDLLLFSPENATTNTINNTIQIITNKYYIYDTTQIIYAINQIRYIL